MFRKLEESQKRKIYLKSNKKCPICGKEVTNNQDYIGTITKTTNYEKHYLVAHKSCLVKRRI